MIRPNTWLGGVAFALVSICFFAPDAASVDFDPNLYAVTSATITDGTILVTIAGDKYVACNVRNVGLRSIGDLKGTYVHLTDEVLTRGTTSRLEIWVRTPELSQEWRKIITDYLETYEEPSDIVPTVER